MAMAYVAESYRDFGPTFASQMLLERHGLSVSRETLRKWMSEEGLWLSRKQRRQFHQPRVRRDHFGELVQIDGSEHRWFAVDASDAEAGFSAAEGVSRGRARRLGFEEARQAEQLILPCCCEDGGSCAYQGQLCGFWTDLGRGEAG
jgi:hypothetical protein